MGSCISAFRLGNAEFLHKEVELFPVFGKVHVVRVSAHDHGIKVCPAL